MLIEERRQLTAVLLAPMAARLPLRELEEQRVIDRLAAVAARLVSALDAAVDVEELVVIAPKAPPVRVADPESAAELCRRCGVVPIEGEDRLLCDACRDAVAPVLAAFVGGLVGRTICGPMAALRLPCPACDAEAGEPCRGVSGGGGFGASMHGVRLERAGEA